MAIPTYFLIHLVAPNTPNGNPNRVFVAIDVISNVVVGAWREGYSGNSVVPQISGLYGRSSPMRIKVSASEARAFLKEGEEALSRDEQRKPFGTARFA